MRENRLIQSGEPCLKIRKQKVLLYIGLQLLFVAGCVAISQTIAAIGKEVTSILVLKGIDHLTKRNQPPGFPVLICVMIPFRVWVLPSMFTGRELQVMDDLTANNKAVLASFDGPPELPGIGAEGYGLSRRYSEKQTGVPRQRSGSITR